MHDNNCNELQFEFYRFNLHCLHLSHNEQLLDEPQRNKMLTLLNKYPSMAGLDLDK